ncbi:Uncharacterised protein [Chromobacterium violaceum]|uniref:Uncharacterized protein n=1 Tax=Chromobacterium violaceum TaxID=536 RepID=A0A3S4I4Z4_CHRVL|nr:Uncharacterised protein [Chromobacterium violaceum]
MSRRVLLLLELLVNFLLPWLCYRWAKPHWGEVGGLLFSAIPLSPGACGSCGGRGAWMR